LKDISVVICGAAGQGIKTVEELLVGILKRSGFHIYATKEYMSRVRGGINSTELRISSQRVASYVERIDILIPLKKEALTHLSHRITDSTKIFADPQIIDDQAVDNKDSLITIPFTEIAKKIGNKIFSNIVVVGVICSIFNIEKQTAIEYLKDRFSSKGESMVNKNVDVFNQGYELGLNPSIKSQIAFNLDRQSGVEDEILLNGSEAVGLGAIAGGCNFISAYPMSPSTGVLIYLAQNSVEFEILIDQAEDEIAAINKTVAAWYAGARAIASTSGGGFALMEEGLSLAGIMESPLVIHIAQRPGPATGLPTRTGQEDLNLVLYAGHGEFPRIIFAPGTISEAFYLTQNAFNLADKFQVPVFILTDQYFVDSYYNISELDISNISVKKYFSETDENYKRYLLTEDGISPRGVPGFGNGLVRADSDEHDEYGHITEDLRGVRPKMMEKRLFKRSKLLNDIISPPTIIGSESASNIIICWGSNYHVLKEALEIVGNSDIAMLHFHQVFPVPYSINDLLTKANNVFIIENNALGQFANVLKLYIDFPIPKDNQFLKCNGEPFSVEELVDYINTKVMSK
jgi:2-oxoglutarate/2-oxoacid ferredoxin oxidoreductase subunit alpha